MFERDVPLAPLTTLGIGGPAKFFLRAESVDDLREACERNQLQLSTGTPPLSAMVNPAKGVLLLGVQVIRGRVRRHRACPEIPNSLLLLGAQIVGGGIWRRCFSVASMQKV